MQQERVFSGVGGVKLYLDWISVVELQIWVSMLCAKLTEAAM